MSAKIRTTIRLSEGMAAWLEAYGGGTLVDGIRRAAREMQILRSLASTDPGMPLRGAMNATEQSLASLGLKTKT